MGCDIHCYIEYRERDMSDREDKSWSSFGGRINPGRNYLMFSLMAGVRGGDGIFEVRGLPEGLGYYSNDDNYLYITADKECNCGECKSVSVENAARWVEGGSSEYKNNREGKPTWVSHPDWHSHSWLSLVEFRQVLEKCYIMNREIKFRVWDNKYKSWMQCGFSYSGVGDFISRGGGGFAFQTILDNETLTDNIHEEIPFNGTNPRWIVQQYTGLKDKNGREIYEGDVLKCKGFDGWFAEVGFYFNMEVKYDTACSGESEISGFLYIPVEREVIGNIFENPELLRDVE